MDITLPTASRRRELQETYMFECTCDACVQTSPDPRSSFRCRTCEALTAFEREHCDPISSHNRLSLSLYSSRFKGSQQRGRRQTRCLSMSSKASPEFWRVPGRSFRRPGSTWESQQTSIFRCVRFPTTLVISYPLTA